MCFVQVGPLFLILIAYAGAQSGNYNCICQVGGQVNVECVCAKNLNQSFVLPLNQEKVNVNMYLSW